MSDFVHDMIHMTEGEKLIYHWPLWVVLGIALFAAAWWVSRK